MQGNRPFVSDWRVKAKQFSHNELLPHSETLTLLSAVRTETGWEVEAVGSDRAACPDCGVISHSRHSHYWRHLHDLPVQGTAVHVRLQLGRWRCRSRECLRDIFVERITGVAVRMRGKCTVWPRFGFW